MNNMAFRLVGSEETCLSAAQLFDEFQQLVLSGRAGVYSLASHYIQPPLFKELFDCIRSSGLDMQTPVAIDLDDNRLNAATVEDFKALLQAMQTPGLDRLLVRLGFEVFVPHLKEAMAELDVQHVYNKRVFVNLLWESGTLALSKQLSENIFELQKSNSILQKMLGATEKRLCAVELLRRKDPSEELARMRAYKDTDAHLVEECVSSAVAAVLDDAVIVHATEYIFKGWIGDLDGMVVGGWRGQEVVVLVEAKHNMDACALKARTELLSAGAYWKELAKMEGSDDESVLSDYAQLHMEKFKHRSIMYAFGGSKFSDAVADHKLHGIPKPWFQVVANSVGKFILNVREDSNMNA